MEPPSNFPLAQPIQKLLVCLLIQRGPQWSGGRLHFQSSGIIVVSPDGSIRPFRTETSRPAEHEVTKTGSTHFASESLRVIVNGVTPCLSLIPGPGILAVEEAPPGAAH